MSVTVPERPKQSPETQKVLGLIDIAAAQTASHYLRGDTSRANSTRETLTRLNTTLGKLLELDSVE